QQGVFMNIPAVRGMAKNFQTISQVLNGVSKTLGALSKVLKATALIGLVGDSVVIHFIEMMKPQIDQMSQKIGAISRDLNASVEAYERGDSQGATRFY